MKKVLRKLYSKTPTSVRLMYGRMWRTRGLVHRLFMPRREVDDLLAKSRLFFLIGSGRCGTMLISTLLNRDPQAMVLHEPLRHSDIEVRPACRQNPQAR